MFYAIIRYMKVRLRWRLDDLLKAASITPYRLHKESGLAMNTVYALARGESKQIRLETLEQLLPALEALTGQPVTLSDLLEVRPRTAGLQQSDAEPSSSDSEVDDIPAYLALAGIFDDEASPGDVSVNHDRYIDEAHWAEYRESLRGRQ
jgi:DNA-binding Xre family transcriptional regulator